MTGLASVHHGDLSILFVLLAVVAFAVAIWRASLRDIPGALLAAFIGVVIVLFAT